MPALAEAGYHVLAPDPRGYGGTAEGPVAYDANLAPFRLHNLLLDLLCLLSVLGETRLTAVIEYGFGPWVAGYAALARPDVFRVCVLMSAPFAGAPGLDALADGLRPRAKGPVHGALAALPRPRALPPLLRLAGRRPRHGRRRGGSGGVPEGLLP